MNERRAKWNDRYLRGEEAHGFIPSSPLPEALAHVGGSGEALDLACGAGRHALFLAEHGFRVTAVDYAASAIALLRAEAERRGLAGAIETVVADVSSSPPEFRIEPKRYELICDFYFLDRSLLPAMLEGVRPGGLFVAAIHTESITAEAPHRFLLAPGELRRTVEAGGFEVLLDRHGSGHSHATSEIVARAPA